MTYDHITETDMVNKEFVYHVYINTREAAIEIYTEEQINTEPTKSILVLSSLGDRIVHVGRYESKDGFITKGLEVAIKKAERTAFPIVSKFDYKIEPVENRSKRKLKRIRTGLEKTVISILLAAIIWKAAEILICLYNYNW